jgi:hypothetical protein
MRERPHTGNNKPKTIPKLIHAILSGREDREVSENTHLDTVFVMRLNLISLLMLYEDPVKRTSNGKLISDAVSLWDEICKRGLEPSKEGRDRALLDELKCRLKPGKGDIRKQLKRVKVEEFVYAFFGIVEPFAKMYAEIYSLMQQFGARRAKENILVKFDFSFRDGKLEFDINKFKDSYEVLRRVGKLKIIWTDDDLLKLFKLFRIIEAGLKDILPTNYVPYRRGANFKLPNVPYFWGGLYEVLIKVREAVQRFIELVDSESNIDSEHPFWGIYCVLTDLVPVLLRILLQDAARLANIEPHKAKEAIDYFEKEIWSKLQFKINEKVVKELLDVLNLPFWKYRWYLYEVWATMHTIDAFTDFNITFKVDSNGTLAVDRSKTTEIATISTDKGDLKFIAQLKTPVAGMRRRKSIKPDLRVCLEPVKNPGSTLLLVELKQRKKITPKYLSEIIDAYEKGCPGSVKNYFLNYDELSPKCNALTTVRSQLVGDFNPSHPALISWYKKDVVEHIINVGYKPEKRFDAILFDISSSMAGRYDSAEVQEAIKTLLLNSPQSLIFLFNTQLIEPKDKDPSAISESLKNAWGGTELEPCLKQLLSNFKDIKHILVITDGEYGEAPSLSKFEVVQCQPTYQGISYVIMKRD